MSYTKVNATDIAVMAYEQIRSINLIRDAHAAREHEAWEKSWDFFWITKAPFRRSIFSLTCYGEEFRDLQALEALAKFSAPKDSERSTTVLVTKDDMRLLIRKFS